MRYDITGIDGLRGVWEGLVSRGDAHDLDIEHGSMVLKCQLASRVRLSPHSQSDSYCTYRTSQGYSGGFPFLRCPAEVQGQEQS